MNIRFSASNELLTELKTIAGAFRLLFLLGLGIIALFLIFWWDTMCENPFSEAGPTELIQTLLLLISSAIFFLEARRCPDMCGALVLTGGLIGCMLIREQDYYLDMLSHGCWKWPALALAISCTAYAGITFRATVAALARFVQWRYFTVLLVGLVIVLAYSRLFGMGMLWKPLLPDGEWRTAKNAIEESSELLGYLFLCFSALLLRFGKK